jgi:hypothetical protein
VRVPGEIGPPPYYHRSDCNICRKQDGLKTGSEFLDVLIVEARRHLLDFGDMEPGRPVAAEHGLLP